MSILGNINTAVQTIVVANTSLLALRIGAISGQQTGTRPYGTLVNGKDRTTSESVSGTVDSHLTSRITVYGESWEQTQVAIEELIVLFYKEGIGLDALKVSVSEVINFKSTAFTASPNRESDSAKLSKFIGFVDFDIHIRYNY